MVNFRLTDVENSEKLSKEISSFPHDGNILLHNVTTIFRLDGFGYELNAYKSFLMSSDGNEILLLKGRDLDKVTDVVSSTGIKFNEISLFHDSDNEPRPFPKLDDIIFASSYTDIDDDDYSFIPVDASISMHYDTSSGEDQLIYAEQIDVALQDGKTIFVSNRLNPSVLLHEMNNISMDSKGRVLKLTK